MAIRAMGRGLGWVALLAVLPLGCLSAESVLPVEGMWEVDFRHPNTTGINFWSKLNLEITYLKNGPTPTLNFSFVWGASSKQPVWFEAPLSKDPNTVPKAPIRDFFPNMLTGIEWDIEAPSTFTIKQYGNDTLQGGEEYYAFSMVLWQVGTILTAQSGQVETMVHTMTYIYRDDMLTYEIGFLGKPVGTMHMTRASATSETADAPRLKGEAAPIHYPSLDRGEWAELSAKEGVQDQAPIQPDPTDLPSAASGEGKSIYVMYLKDEWNIHTIGFDWNALLIALQGLVNREAPRLYFVYPSDWAFNYTPNILKHFEQKGYMVTNITSPEQALKIFGGYTNGLVQWDSDVPNSLTVAYTIAGLMDLLPASPKLAKMLADQYPVVENLQGKLTGMNDTQIFMWAKERYWEQTSRTAILWLGGSCAPVKRPGIADWGVAQRAFFTDLSTVPGNSEYDLADDLMSDMDSTNFVVFGWHSYCKDSEHTFVALTSKHGGRVHGLNTFPNLSFINKVPVTPGFKWVNNVNRTVATSPPKKVLLGLVQTDGIGLGAWTKPGRGTIEYSWEVSTDALKYTGALLEYFYSQATPKDLFVGGLSGPGYMYPKVMPQKYLDPLLELTQEGYTKLGLEVMTIFDASSVPPHWSSSAMGDTTLPKEIVDTYFQQMPNITGYLNGYGPSFTFAEDKESQRALLSFDYYLSPSRTVEEAVDDLQQLAKLNGDRPYYLVVHVREWSTVARVEKIVERLGEGFEVVPVDYLLRTAGLFPTFKTRYS